MRRKYIPGLRASLIKEGECNHVFEGMDLSAAAERVRAPPYPRSLGSGEI